MLLVDPVGSRRPRSAGALRAHSLQLALALSSIVAACGGAPVATAVTPTVEDVEEGQATCKVAKDPLNPLIVEWPGTSKVALDSASQGGVVVVSYVGCVLKVLTSCQAGGSYGLKGVTPVSDRVTVESESDLYARLPLGVAVLKAELATYGRLDLNYVAVGQREADKPPAMLQGDCAGATHYVRTIMVGAYQLDAVGKAKAAGGAEVADRGAGFDHKEGVRRLRGSGDVAACSQVQPNVSACNAVLQLGLSPLTVGSGGAVTAAGFGAGLGALAVVPTVQEITTLPGGGQGLKEADVALLRQLQEAKRTDKSVATPEQKAAAWDALAVYAGQNPYKELAERRRDDWKQVADAEARRREQVKQVCALYTKDSTKLGQLVALDDDVVSQKQKEAYKKELAQVYAAHKATLGECGAPAPGSGGPAMGLWKSTFGAVKIEVDAKKGQGAVRGVWTYQRRGEEVIGHFSGQLSGNVMKFTWTEPSGTGAPLVGAGELVFERDGQRFTGKWWTDARDRTGEWTGWR